jgi:hypothetical protein
MHGGERQAGLPLTGPAPGPPLLRRAGADQANARGSRAGGPSLDQRRWTYSAF